MTPQEMNRFINNYHKQEDEFRGRIIGNAISLDQVLGLIIMHHFIELEKRPDFFNLIMPQIGIERKIQIFKQILEFPQYKTIKQKHPKIISDLSSLVKHRNKLAHWTSDLFENMLSSTKNEQDITLTVFKNGKLQTLRITENQQKQITKLIQKCSSILTEIMIEIDLVNNR